MYSRYIITQTDKIPSIAEYYDISLADDDMLKKNGKELKNLDVFKTLLYEGRFDADKLQNMYFPNGHYDIFLSHSHIEEDKGKVAAFVGLLSMLGLKIFVDPFVWGSASDMLLQLDNKYSEKSPGLYDYNDSNYLAENVYNMLFAALIKMMDNAECVMFFETPNTFYIGKKGDIAKTISPWIYQERLLSGFIRRKELREYREIRKSIESSYFSKGGLPRFEYPFGLKGIAQIDANNIIEWIDGYKSNEHALDALYELVPAVCGEANMQYEGVQYE